MYESEGRRYDREGSGSGSGTGVVILEKEGSAIGRNLPLSGFFSLPSPVRAGGKHRKKKEDET